MERTKEQEILLDLVDLVRSKLDYGRRRAERNAKPVLARLFSPAVQDPVPGYSVEQLCDTCRQLFKEAWPNVHSFRVASVDNPSVLRCDTEFTVSDKDGSVHLHTKVFDAEKNVFHDEWFDCEKGFGFVHRYDNDPSCTKRELGKRRLNAQAYALKERLRMSSEFMRYYCALDSFCRSEEALELGDGGRPEKWSRRRADTLMDEVKVDLFKINAREAMLFDVRNDAFRSHLVRDVKSYLSARAEMYRVCRLLSDDSSTLEPEVLRATYEGIALNTVFKSPGETLSLGLKEQKGKVELTLNDVYAYACNAAKVEFFMRPELFTTYEQSKVNKTFARAAFLTGFSKREISLYLGHNAPKLDYRVEPNYDVVLDRCACQYQALLDVSAHRADKERAGAGVPDRTLNASSVFSLPVPCPLDVVKKDMEETLTLSHIFDWAMKNEYFVNAFTHVPSMKLTSAFISEGLVGTVPLDKFCDFLKFPVDLFVCGVKDAIVWNFRERLRTERDDFLESPLAGEDGRQIPEAAVLRSAVLLLLEEKRYERLGSLLYDAGIYLNSGKSVAKSFVDTGRRIREGRLNSTSLSWPEMTQRYGIEFRKVTPKRSESPTARKPNTMKI